MRAKKDKTKPDLKKSVITGTLYIVATPIGNLEDITLRAARILDEVDLIAAEDTRHTRKLLSHLGISTPLLSYYKEKEASRAGQIINRLTKGENVALVSDAGTPGISDPGHILVRQAREAGIPITPIPGPSSLSAALSVTGQTNAPLIFFEFLPSKPSERRKLLQGVAHEQKNIVFFESPRRLKACLKDCLNILGDRQAFWAREITKVHESLQSALLSQFVATTEAMPQKGESVIFICGATEKETIAADDIDELLRRYRDEDSTLKDAVRQISRDLDLPRNQVYKRALAVWK